MHTANISTGPKTAATRSPRKAIATCSPSSIRIAHTFCPYAHVFSVIHAADPDQVSAQDVMSQVHERRRLAGARLVSAA